MQRPDRVTRLIRVIAVRKALLLTTNNKHYDALLTLLDDANRDLSDADRERIHLAVSQASKTARELVDEWAADSP